MFISMSTTFKTLGDLRQALVNFPDDIELVIDPASPSPNEEGVKLEDYTSLVYECRCDDVPRLYMSFVPTEDCDV